jgi:hypothetical protein
MGYLGSRDKRTKVVEALQNSELACRMDTASEGAQLKLKMLNSLNNVIHCSRCDMVLRIASEVHTLGTQSIWVSLRASHLAS